MAKSSGKCVWGVQIVNYEQYRYENVKGIRMYCKSVTGIYM